MSLIIAKFGGSSVATIKKIKAVAGIIANHYKGGKKIAVVVSAMGDTTDELEKKINSITNSHSYSESSWSSDGYDAKNHIKQERDAILASGEQTSAGLLALELIHLGLKAESFCGWQIPIISNDVHGSAKIEYINSAILHSKLDEGIIPIIAGFQGVFEGRITTFGRGGSDTTATAIASALGADECLIYTDVSGIYSCDPKKVANAEVIDEISYEECLEIAASGGKVIHPRAVEIALRNSFSLRVLQTDKPEGLGTIILNKKKIENEEVVGISADPDQVLIALEGLENVPGVASAIFDQLSGISVNADLIVQNISYHSNYSDLSFTVKECDKERVISSIQNINHIAYSKLSVCSDVAKISVVGIGLKRYSDIAKKMFQILAKQGINILLVSTSEIKISVLVKRDFAQIGVEALHKEFIEKR